MDTGSMHVYYFRERGGELTGVVYDSEYAYYANGWLDSVKSGASDVADYTYDVVGNRTQVDLGNGTYTTYAYDTDPRYRLTTITHKNSSNATLATIDYTSTARDKVGNPKSMTDWTGTWAYGYDDMNRLTSATAPAPVPGQPAGGSGALAYGYDWVGNRIHPPSDPNAMVYNTADQLTSWPGMRQYTYYPDGSLHHVLNAGGTSTLASYAYTPTGLLATATYNGRTLTNTWDANANRVTLTSPGATYDLKREFVYDPTAGIPAVVQETQVNDPDEPDDDVHVYYFREPGGSLISRLEGANTSYYHFDALGSTRLLTDGDGDVTDKYAYDAYGSLISHERTTNSVDQPYQYIGRFGYYTCYQEPEFGLLQLGVRFFDGQIGRFTQWDPLRQDLSLYCYVGSNPMTRTDPSGLYTPDWYFSKHFLTMVGHGRPLSLNALGFIASYRNTSAVQAAVENFKTLVHGGCRDAAREVCSQHPSSGLEVTEWKASEERQGIDTFLDFGWRTVAGHSLYHKASCTVYAKCCRHEFRYECDLGFRMYDRFRDPTGTGIHIPGTSPFTITGSWSEWYGGNGKM